MKYLKKDYIQNKYDLPSTLYDNMVCIIDDYFEKLQSSFISTEMLIEPGNVLVMGEATGILCSKDIWDELVYNYMKRFRNDFFLGVHTNLGFSYGLPYISSILHFYSRKTGYYKKFLNSLDKTILYYLDKKIDEITQNPEIKTADFDMIFGMAGVSQYLFELPEEKTYSLLNKIGKYLSSLANYKSYNKYNIPGWKTVQDDPIARYSRDRFPNGHINYGMAHGITGVLASLVKFSERNIQKKEVDKAIDIILEELEKVKFISADDIVYYPGMLSVEHYVNNQFFEDNNKRMSWCYGSISVLYTLYRTYEHLGKTDKCVQIIKEIEKIVEAGNKCWLLESPIICHGYAGTAHVLKQFFIKTGSLIIKKGYEHLLTLVLKSYNKNFLYGFKDIYYKLDGDTWEKVEEDKDTFLEGASGIVSVLLGFLNDDEFVSTLLLLN